MQPSELWRRGVVMALTAEAAEQIDAGNVDESTPVQFLPIPGEALFGELWGSGLFAAINRACGSLIDDYESEWLQPEQLPAAGRVVDALHRKRPDGEVGEFLRGLSALIGRAIEGRMRLYFEC
jgi:hypothetical protein